MINFLKQPFNLSAPLGLQINYELNFLCVGMRGSGYANTNPRFYDIHGITFTRSIRGVSLAASRALDHSREKMDRFEY